MRFSVTAFLTNLTLQKLQAALMNPLCVLCQIQTEASSQVSIKQLKRQTFPSGVVANLNLSNDTNQYSATTCSLHINFVNITVYTGFHKKPLLLLFYIDRECGWLWPTATLIWANCNPNPNHISNKFYSKGSSGQKVWHVRYKLIRQRWTTLWPWVHHLLKCSGYARTSSEGQRSRWVWPHADLLHFCEQYISETTLENWFKTGTNAQLDSRMRGFHLGALRSKVTVTSCYIQCHIFETP